MKKRMISIALALTVTVGLTACDQKASGSKSPPKPEVGTETASGTSEQTKTDVDANLPEVKLVFSTQSSGDVNYAKVIRMVAGEISEKASGKFTMGIHENRSLMTQEGEVDAIARRSLNIMFSLPSLISGQLSHLTVFIVAYIFQNKQHMRVIMDGEIGQKVMDDVAEKLNARWLSAPYCRAKHPDVRNVGRKIIKPEDLNGINLKMPNSFAWLFMDKVLGANSTPMVYARIYQRLQTDAIDGQKNPLPTTIAQKWYEVTSQIVLTDHVTEPTCIVINEQKRQTLPQKYRSIMTEAVKTATIWCDEANLKQEQGVTTFLKERGLTVIESDLDVFMGYSENYHLNSKDMVKDWGMGLYHQIKGLKYQ